MVPKTALISAAMKDAPTPKQIDAFVRAHLAILSEYRKFIAFAADL